MEKKVVENINKKETKNITMARPGGQIIYNYPVL